MASSSMLGRFHGYPDVYPWSIIHVVSIATPSDGNADVIDLFEVTGGIPRGFVVTDSVALDCISWSQYNGDEADADQFVTAGFPVGTHFGSLRKIRTKGTGGTTTSTNVDTIMFFR